MKPSGSELLTVHEVACRVGIGVWTVWKWTASGLLPAPVRLSGRRYTRWRMAELDSWIAQLPVRR
jgi:excisionase family DNA binding protein